MPDRCLLYPGHDYRGLTVTSVGEEKLYNPRLAESIGEGDFVGYMTHLGLPHPKQMELAVPANLKCGKPLTTTAADYFARLGFVRIDRDAAPPAIRATAQFASLCPASAHVMRRELAL